MRLTIVALLLGLVGCAEVPRGLPGPSGVASGPWRQQTHWIAMTQGDGSPALLLGRVCRPAGDGPSRVVVLAHGTPPVASDRARVQPTACDSEAARWFLTRGYLVVMSVRRGYGGTGGAYVEGNPQCSIDGYVSAAREAARDVLATVQYALSLPYARPDGAVVVGQSAGGWAADGVDSLPHPEVIALVSMAGGRGGHMDNQPNHNCHAENLEAAAGRLGRTSTTPMLWIFTQNDSYFAPPIARGMHEAFIRAGGVAALHALPAYGDDGHRLFFGAGGSLVWGPLVERYLAERGAT